MDVAEALKCLGSERVIWIDDRFDTTPHSLARALMRNFEIAKKCGFNELAEAFDSIQYGEAEGEANIRQVLADLPVDRIGEINEIFLSREAEENLAPADELSPNEIEQACVLLAINKSDRWSFSKADTEIVLLCSAGNSKVSYIVDLKEQGGSDKRGLSTLRRLVSNKSQGTAFILTHEADLNDESTVEDDLRKDLAENGGDEFAVPICVISKARLNAETTEALSEGLNTSIKRAGLRRAMHEVLIQARDQAGKAFEEASRRLLSVPPEQLESYVFDRGFKEGVSELHVVERAITSHAGQQLRSYFGSDPSVHVNIERLRSLKNIKLGSAATPPNENLVQFRKAEVWESDELINSAFAPIACGDVFETDVAERVTQNLSRKYLVLAQPCDIALRPDGKRSQNTAFFIPLKKRNNSSGGNLKLAYFPFTLDGEQWACDFREATIANVSVLDLASFRKDGRVRVDEGSTVPKELLVSQQQIYSKRTEAARERLASGNQAGTEHPIDPRLQLTFALGKPFNGISCGAYEPSVQPKANGDPSDNISRVTWRLRRGGRVRAHYATALLDQYLAMMSRHAFEIDYMSAEGEVSLPQGNA